MNQDEIRFKAIELAQNEISLVNKASGVQKFHVTEDAIVELSQKYINIFLKLKLVK